MADQNITELPVKTSSGITSSDYMLGIDSAEGYQMLIRDLGDYIIRNVQVNTIAGSNQTLKSALDTLNSNMDDTRARTLFGDNTALSNADFDTLESGWHFIGTGSTHGPGGDWMLVRTLANRGGGKAQIAYKINGASYSRSHNGSAWSDWYQYAKQSDVDALNRKTDVGITAAEGVQLSSTSKICVTGTYIFIYVKGKALETKTNAQLCTFGGNKNVYTACTVPIGLGDSEWDISSTGYGFISEKSIVGSVQENKWFHIFITIPFA